MASSSRSRGGGVGAVFPVLFGLLLVGFYWVIWSNQIELSLHIFSGYVAGILCYLATLMEVRVGLTIMLVAIGLSPEIGTGSMADLRVEDAIIPAVFFGWVTRLIVNREELFSSPLKAPIFGYLTIALITTLNGITFFAADPQRCMIHYLKVVEYFLMFLMVLNNVRSYEQARFFVTMLVVSSCLTGFYGFFLSRSLIAGARLAGPPGEGANIIGGYFAFHVVLVCGLASTARPSLRRVLILLAVIVLGIPMMRTASRASFVSLIVGLITIGIMSRGKFVFGFIPIFLLMPLLMPDTVLERLLTILALVPGSNQPIPSSFDAKVSSWRDNLHTYVLERPVLGSGMGVFSLAHVDNEYVKVAMEVGVIGLLFFLTMLWRMLRMGRETYRETRDPLYKGFSLGYVGALSALIVHSWGSASMTTIRTMEPLMFATGIMGAIYHMEIVIPAEEERHESHQRRREYGHVARRRYRS